MECSLHRALQGTLAILTRVRPRDPDGPTPCASWEARLAITDAYPGPDGQALFGPAREAPAGAGPAGQLAAFLGRAV
jgi:hypothetical protein